MRSSVTVAYSRVLGVGDGRLFSAAAGVDEFGAAADCDWLLAGRVSAGDAGPGVDADVD